MKRWLKSFPAANMGTPAPEAMEVDGLRPDLSSILPFLPLVARSSSTLFWPPQAVESLRALSRGPKVSAIRSGADFFRLITDLRGSLGLSGERLALGAAEGYSLFFDELITRDEARQWFEETVPALARLLMRLPSLFDEHYKNADHIFEYGVNTGLRILATQEAGVVFLSQELIGALLACSLFCLFPHTERGGHQLPTINFDYLFGLLCNTEKDSQEHKILCLKHYFERICLSMPSGYVSFQRKVLPLKQGLTMSYRGTDYWSKSSVSLCSFEVMNSGLIEDQQQGAIEVDFANKFIGGGALSAGCVQEEIRFMINPELIAAMLFLPAMGYNEAVEIVGVERFSRYGGYASSFHFLGDYQDDRPIDSLGRRKTKIVVIDALANARNNQFTVEGLLRESNKALCGFVHQPLQEVSTKMECRSSPTTANHDWEKSLHSDGNDGVATGNWGCGAFGGDLELKSIIQWLAASQAERQFILYYVFKQSSLDRLKEVTEWIVAHKWSVGDLWNMMVEYSSQRLNKETDIGFFEWLLPTSK